jgi:hypothetical protein
MGPPAGCPPRLKEDGLLAPPTCRAVDAPTTPPAHNATIFMAAGFQAAVIAWPHKLIVSPWFVELYDLSQDPSESVDVAASSPEIVQTLTRAISREGLIDP